MATLPFTVRGPEAGGNFEYQWSGPFLQVHFLSDVGKKRGHNEDSCLLCAPESSVDAGEQGYLFSIADGMGGASAGEFASRLALKTLCDEYYQSAEGQTPERLQRALESANQSIFEAAEHSPEYYGMGTTVSAVVIKGSCAYIAQVGDSRVYVSRENHRVQQLTDDHSLVAEQVRGGYLTQEEANNHALRHLITRAVGIREQLSTDLFAFRLKEGDTLLICSDGLTNVVSDDDVEDAMRLSNLQGAARVLVGRALEGGGPDNISVALIRVTAPPPKMPLESGATEITLARPGLLGRLRKLIL